MRASEWRTHDAAELEFQLGELRKRMFELRFRTASEEISDKKEVMRVRRDIARVLTIQAERNARSDKGVQT